jgi:hypothetical protein
VAKETLESELNRLREEQSKTRQDELFVGLSPAERAEYYRKSERIYELQGEMQMSAIAEQSSRSAKTEQRRQWNKASETDTPQDEAHQPYRSREKDSVNTSADQRRKRGKGKNEPKEKGS